MDFFEFLKNPDNFLHVLPIMVAFVFAAVIIVERVRSLFFSYPMKNAQAFFDKITHLVLAGKTNDAVALCDENKSKPISHVVKAALIRGHLPESLIENSVEMAGGEASRSILKRTAFLATFANLATLLGLFGTIQGLVKAFSAVKHADPQQKSAMLTDGIATAMNATMMGLGVAILCMAAFAVLVNKANELAQEIDHGGVQILDILKQRFYTADIEENPVSNGHGNPHNSLKEEITRKAA